mgnify:CR=1 FL=1
MKKKGWNKRVFVAILVIVMAAACFGCGRNTSTREEEKQEEQTPDGIYLYGEIHVNANIMKKELELWGEYYDDGMRDLFVELPYFDAQLMNIWMQSADDDILTCFFKIARERQGALRSIRIFGKN